MILLPPTKWIQITEPWLCLKPEQNVFTTLEGNHLGGSIKDRMVIGELNELFENGKINRNTIIGEVSSGSTARSLAFHFKALSVRCTLYVPDGTDRSIINELIGNLATVRMYPLEILYQKFNEELRINKDLFNFNQLFDETKQRHYNSFGAEVARRYSKLNFLLGGVGTGHSLTGTASGIRNELTKLFPNGKTKNFGEIQPNVKKFRVISIEPDSKYRLSGVRNIVNERYGDLDPCHENNFDQRIVIFKEELFNSNFVKVLQGDMVISDSFKLVLSGAKDLLKKQGSCDVFLLGAASKLNKSNLIKEVA